MSDLLTFVFDDVLGPTVGSTYAEKADNCIDSIADKIGRPTMPGLVRAWQVIPIYPYFQIRTFDDMAPFIVGEGGDGYQFWLVEPVAGDTRNPVLIVDDLRGFTVPEGIDVIITGTTNKFFVNQAVAAAMATKQVGLYSPHSLWPYIPALEADGSNVDDAQPNLFMQWKPPDGTAVRQFLPLPGVGVALNTSVGGLSNGGYNFFNLSGPISIFLGRSDGTDGDNNPGPLTWYFSKSLFGSQFLYSMVENEDRSGPIAFDLTLIDFTISCTETGLCIKQTPSGGHLEASLVKIGDNVTGAFMVCFGSTFFSQSFREHPNCNGDMLLVRTDNDTQLYTNTNGKHAPRVKCIFSDDVDGNQWENKLGQISEAWVSFNTTFDAVSPIIGIMPHCLVVHKPLNSIYPSDLTDEVPDWTKFPFDQINPTDTSITSRSRTWRVFTHMCQNTSNGSMGTLCFETNDIFNLGNVTCPSE